MGQHPSDEEIYKMISEFDENKGCIGMKVMNKIIMNLEYKDFMKAMAIQKIASNNLDENDTSIININFRLLLNSI